MGDKQYANPRVFVLRNRVSEGKGNGTNERPTDSIAWTLSPSSPHADIRVASLLAVLRGITPEDMKDQPMGFAGVWNTMNMEYTANGVPCVLAVPMDLGSVHTNQWGIYTGVQPSYALTINGQKIRAYGYPYPAFYDGLVQEKYLDPRSPSTRCSAFNIMPSMTLDRWQSHGCANQAIADWEDDFGSTLAGAWSVSREVVRDELSEGYETLDGTRVRWPSHLVTWKRLALRTFEASMGDDVAHWDCPPTHRYRVRAVSSSGDLPQVLLSAHGVLITQSSPIPDPSGSILDKNMKRVLLVCLPRPPLEVLPYVKEGL